MNFKTYWINLEKDEERRTNMIKKFEEFEIQHQRVPAKSHNLPHIGCCLSHIEMIYQAYINLRTKGSEKISKDEYVLFMEDDVIINDSIYDIHNIVKLLPSDWDVLQLHIIDPNLLYQIIERLNQNQPCINKIMKGYFMSAACYVMSKKGIQKFINFTLQDSSFESQDSNFLNENKFYISNYKIQGLNLKINLDNPLCKSEEMIYRYLESYTLLIPLFNTLETYNSNIDKDKEYMERNHRNMVILNDIHNMNRDSNITFDNHIPILPYDLHFINNFYLQNRIVSRLYKLEKEFLIFLNNGLGNRMFQFSSIYSLARKNNCKFGIFYSCLDLEYDNNIEAKRNYLDFFRILKSNHLQHHYPILKTNKILDVIIEPKQSIYAYKGIPINHCRYIDKIDVSSTKIDENLTYIFNGEFQNEENFIDYRDELLYFFREPPNITNILNKLGDVYDNTVAIHVRLGNFIGSKKHFINLNEYYRKCIIKIQNTMTVVKFVIVSDEKDTKKIYKIYPFLQGIPSLITETKDEVLDLYFMSRCKGVICSNSLFSWWGTWLNPREDGLFYIPHNFDNHFKFIKMKKAQVILADIVY